jgi:hypothetical protein
MGACFMIKKYVVVSEQEFFSQIKNEGIDKALDSLDDMDVQQTEGGRLPPIAENQLLLFIEDIKQVSRSKAASIFRIMMSK